MATGCKGCDANCFDSYVIDGCVGYTGGVYDDLGITADMSQKQVNEKLVEGILALQEKVKCCNDCGDGEISSSSTSNVSLAGFSANYSNCSSKITHTNLKYEIVPGNSSIAVSYNFGDIVDNLPSGYTAVRKEIKAYGSGNNSVHVSTDKTVGSFTVAASKFPLSLEVMVILSTSCGTINLEQTIPLNSIQAGQYTSNLYIRDFGRTEESDVTQNEFNDTVKDKVLLTERTVQTLQNPNVSGTTNVSLKSGASLDNVVQTLINEIDALKAKSL